ncbi:MAG: hypothetical protein JXM70_19975 [Pirellulales bacterium]|nr:hypothetical protein [Pirellulales bacterium]
MYQLLKPYNSNWVLLGAICLLMVAFLFGCDQEMGSQKTVTKDPGQDAKRPSGIATEDTHPKTSPESKSDSRETASSEKKVELDSCDGENKVTVSKDLTGQPLAHALLDQWKRDHPDRDWVAEEKRAHAFKPPADNSDLLKGDQGKGHAYGNYTQRDILTWTREAEKFVAEGSRIFHSAGELGSTVGVSCDMCHPHAANTHPETYPKFQTQLGRVVLLRDMIDWCVENPVRGKHLDPDGPKMRALEAYIMAQRKGVKMNYGKH